MKDQCLVSVLMSIYNTPLNYLKESVESIRNQSHKNLQIVLIDDCSSDPEIPSFLDEIMEEDHRIELIRNEKNQGLTKSLNIGLDQCQGEYIARMDADDVSYIDRIKKQVAYMDMHPDVCLTGSDIAVFEENVDHATPVHVEARYQDQELFEISMLFNHYGLPHPTFMFRRSFLDEHHIRYRENILKSQDYAIKVDCLKAGGRLVHLQEVLLAYRVHPGQISSTSNREQEKYTTEISREYIHDVFPELDEEQNIILSTMHTGDYNMSPRKYVKAIKILIMLNETKNEYKKDLFKKEMYYQWIRKSYRGWLNHNGYSTLFYPFTLKSFFLCK